MDNRRILFVEDDAFKAERVRKCLDRIQRDLDVKLATSVQSAVSFLASDEFDLILLDMALPSHDLRPGGGSPSSLLSGGIEIIMELSFLERQEKVIVLTQYPEIEIEGELVAIDKAKAALENICPINLVATIQYKHEETDWESTLIEAIG